MQKCSGFVFGLLSLFLGYSGLAYGQSSPEAYTEVYKYDLAGRLLGTVLPDPDGPGSNRYSANRMTYNAMGQLVKLEFGVLLSWPSASALPSQWAGFTVHRVEDRYYDGKSRVQSVRVSSAGSALSLVQYSYDVYGRLTCTAQRMNALAYASLLNNVNACVQGPTGSFGPDRISRNHYDSRSRVEKVERGVGTTLQQYEAIYAFNRVDQPLSMTDAKGNVTEYVYDGMGRLKRTRYPSKTAPGQVSSTDYEEYGYDPNGNRTYLRRRDARYVYYSYDRLNRVRIKNLPTDQDVYYGYDLRGGLSYARFVSHSGAGVTNTYNGFGELTGQTTSLPGFYKTVSYGYDQGGNRAWISHSDNAQFYYGYDGYSRLRNIQNDSGSTLASVYYDSKGLRYRAIWGGQWSTTYLYDGLSRLTQLSHDVAGSSNDVTYSFGYSPSSQMSSRYISNTLYQVPGTEVDPSVAGSYAPNGLNQYASAGGRTYSHDNNGNLSGDGGVSLSYDNENKMTGVSGGVNALMKYDPLGRLYEISQSGTTTRFQYDGDVLIAEYDGSGNLTQRYVHGNRVNEPMIWFEGSGVRLTDAHYLLADHQGSVVLAVDAQGDRLYHNVYHPFGSIQGGGNGRFRYTGQMYLPEVGLNYYKARMYGSQIGRFLQPDPIGTEDQYNLYTYVSNDPINQIDPTGEVEESIIAEFGNSTVRVTYNSETNISTLYVRAVSERLTKHDPEYDGSNSVPFVIRRVTDGEFGDPEPQGKYAGYIETVNIDNAVDRPNLLQKMGLLSTRKTERVRGVGRTTYISDTDYYTTTDVRQNDVDVSKFDFVENRSTLSLKFSFDWTAFLQSGSGNSGSLDTPEGLQPMGAPMGIVVPFRAFDATGGGNSNCPAAAAAVC